MVDVFARSFVFFFKQKTAYEMRISDWSSDVCSSDLGGEALPERFLTVAAGNHDRHLAVHRAQFRCERIASAVRQADVDECGIDPAVGKTDLVQRFHRRYRLLDPKAQQIGRASCRERVCQYVSNSVVAVSLNKKDKYLHQLITKCLP